MSTINSGGQLLVFLTAATYLHFFIYIIQGLRTGGGGIHAPDRKIYMSVTSMYQV